MPNWKHHNPQVDQFVRARYHSNFYVTVMTQYEISYVFVRLKPTLRNQNHLYDDVRIVQTTAYYFSKNYT